MVRFLPLAATPEVAAPWQIYRTSIQEGPRTIKQLRIEIGHPGDKGDPKLSRLVIGTRDGDNFSPCLTVTSDCEVTIEGSLTVSGELIRGPITPDLGDPRFTDEIANQWALGTLIAEEKLGGLFSGVNSGELSALITDDQERRLDGRIIAPDQPLSYFFLIRNTSTSTITNIQLYVNATFGDDSRPEKLPPTQFSLTPGENRLVEASAPLDPGGNEGLINISVSVLGVGPQPKVIAAADSAVIRVEEPVIG